MEVFEDLLEVSDSCEFGSCFKRRRVQSQIVSFRSQRGRGSVFYYYGFYVSVSFLRLHKTCLRQKHENCIFLLNLELLGNFCYKFSQKGRNNSSYTLKYFWEHGRRRRIQNQLNYISCFYLKSLTSKRCYMQV